MQTNLQARIAHVVPVSLFACVLLFTASARADDAPLNLSISVERVAGVAYASFAPSGAGGSITATTVGLGGPAINPLGLPRAGGDVLLPMGLTLGGAVGYGNVSLSSNPTNGSSTSVSGDAWLLSPRVGYLLHLAPFLDLWPRAGVTFGEVSASLPTSVTSATICSSGATGCTTSTTTNASEGASLFAVSISPEVVAVVRLTRSFNLLGGVSLDYVFATSGSAGPDGNTQSVNTGGTYYGIQGWLGLGGYVF
jgi:hypothetical protein